MKPIVVNSNSLKVLHDIESEPAFDILSRLIAGESIGEVCDELGYEREYGLRLVSLIVARDLISGNEYESFANLLGEFEHEFWGHLKEELPREIAYSVSRERRVWLLTRINELLSCGVEPELIAPMLGLPVSQMPENTRSAKIVGLRLQGETLESIGKQVNLTRERVRQILIDLGIDREFLRKKSESSMQLEQINKVRQTIGSWVEQHPGCTPEEIAAALTLQQESVQDLIPSSSSHLVLDSRFDVAGQEIQSRAESRARIIRAIRSAADIWNSNSGSQLPKGLFLTGPQYTSLQKQGLVEGPTLPRVLQVFGTWRNACELAGVLCDDPVHIEYERRWSRNEMSHYVAEFLVTEGHKGVSKYDIWARKDASRPGFGTVRNEFGGWRAAYEEALRLLRTRWVMKT